MQKSSNSSLGFCKQADGFILVFDLTKQESFEELSEWIESIRLHKDIGTFPLIIVGNKLDLCPKSRKVP